ncbi:hypothetical protein HPB51_018478 [Rhipicephalus microplus]|uniref:Uncharacterized protein n=1 Tax=Rhipicephalus microplus TaxID=6941 RepID=A0A9J6DB62_RHIMP|nr:hypothetical protein HPB51_018478 [Rhipicephalus microplus]
MVNGEGSVRLRSSRLMGTPAPPPLKIEVEQAIKRYGNKEVKWSSQGMLRLEPAAMRELFRPTLARIKEHIGSVLGDPHLGAIHYLFLVGGFAESQMLQKELREAFTPHTRVIIPQHHFKSFLVRRLLAKIDRKDEGDLQISLLDAIHFIAMAWDRVTPTTVANCFGKCGFFGSPEEVPPEPEDPTIEDWEQLNVECTSDDFCTADDNLATRGARTVEDIVEEATCGDADSSDDGDDIDVGDGEGPPPAAETLHALDVLRRAVAADEVSDDTCRRFYAFEQSLLGDLAKKKRQKDIRDFFIKK